jgi:hypothetical protein
MRQNWNKNGFLGKEAQIFLIFTLLIIVLLVQSATSESSNPALQSTTGTGGPSGAIKQGSSVSWEVEKVGRLNINPEIAQPGEKVSYNYETYSTFNSGVNITLRFRNDEAYVDYIEVYQDVPTTIEITNVSINEVYYAENDTHSNVTSINRTTEIVLTKDWVQVPISSYVDGNDYYYTTRFNIGQNVRYTPKPKIYGSLIKYDAIFHPSTLSPTQSIRVEIDPLINATEANITSNSDLNQSRSTARFIDGKLIAAAGNRSNITGWDTWSDNDWTNNPQWIPCNSSQNIFVNATHNVALTNKIIAITSTTSDPGASGTGTGLIRNVNISIPTTTGVVVRGSLKLVWYSSGSNMAGICFQTAWDKWQANQTGTTSINFCSNQNGGSGVRFFVDDSRNIYLGALSGGDILLTGKYTNSTWINYTLWFNLTSARVIINMTEGGATDSGIYNFSQQNMSSGGEFILYNAGGTVSNSTAYFNFFAVANVSDPGLHQPFNLTPAVMQTNVLSSTALISAVKIQNQTMNYASTKANFYVFDTNHSNLQSVNEGSYSSASLTGIGINATFTPSGLYSASEFKSILTDWNWKTTNATESEGVLALKLAIDQAVPSATQYTYQKIYLVNASGSQWQGTTDYLIVQNNPPKRWLLNYVTSGENYLNASNLSNTVYVLELSNKPYIDIYNGALALINSTKS